LIFTQQKIEIKLFNQATLEILNAANIKQTVFNQSVGLFTALSSDLGLLKIAQLSLYSPFIFKT
jgi:hypothetical protein